MGRIAGFLRRSCTCYMDAGKDGSRSNTARGQLKRNSWKSRSFSYYRAKSGEEENSMKPDRSGIPKRNGKKKLLGRLKRCRQKSSSFEEEPGQTVKKPDSRSSLRKHFNKSNSSPSLCKESNSSPGLCRQSNSTSQMELAASSELFEELEESVRDSVMEGVVEGVAGRHSAGSQVGADTGTVRSPGKGLLRSKSYIVNGRGATSSVFTICVCH